LLRKLLETAVPAWQKGWSTDTLAVAPARLPLTPTSRALLLGLMRLTGAPSAPLYWAQRGDDGTDSARNGSAFFLRTPKALFGVTAAHVVEGPEGWRESCAQHGKAPLRLGGRNGDRTDFDAEAEALLKAWESLRQAVGS
jgi:hypothetical protein